MPGEAERIRARVQAAGESALRVVAEDLLGEAQRLAPVEEGTLRASGDVEVEHGVGGMTVATVSFASIYAAAQHEGLDFEHPKGGQAKFLEQPLRAKAARYDRIIAAAISRAL